MTYTCVALLVARDQLFRCIANRTYDVWTNHLGVHKVGGLRKRCQVALCVQGTVLPFWHNESIKTPISLMSSYTREIWSSHNKAKFFCPTESLFFLRYNRKDWYQWILTVLLTLILQSIFCASNRCHKSPVNLVVRVLDAKLVTTFPVLIG